MTTTFLFDATEYTPAQLVEVVRQQLAQPYGFADNLRTAVMYSPKTMASGEFVTAAVACGVNPGTARNRYSEVRRWQREMGEI